MSQRPHFILTSTTVLLGFIAFILSGCAYRFSSVDRSLPGNHSIVGMPVFKNLTHEPGIETYFTNAMVRELERSQVAQVVEQKNATVSLLGTVEDVQYVSAGASNVGLPTGTLLNVGYRILVRVSLKLVRNSDGQPIWSSTFLGERSYAAPRVLNENLNSSNALYNQSTRIDNIKLIAQDLMLEAFSQMTESY
jgi:TolB-like protein